jgi:acetyltransferase
VGTELLTRLIDVARQEGLQRIVAEILDTNGAMIRLSRKLGFTIKGDPMEGSLQAELDLTKG